MIEIALGLATIVGALLAVPPFFDWVTGFRRRRTIDRVLAGLEDQEGAEAAHRELQELRGLIRNARDAIQSHVPREARTQYLKYQRGELAHRIGHDFAEYERTDRELVALEAESALDGSAIPDYVAQAIRREIAPLHSARRREVMWQRFVAVLAIVLIVVPYEYSPSSLVRDYFQVAFDDGYFLTRQVVADGLWGGLALLPLGAWLQFRLRRFSRQVAWTVTCSAVVLFALLVVVLLGMDPYVSDDSRHSTGWVVIAVSVFGGIAAGGVSVGLFGRIRRNRGRRWAGDSPEDAVLTGTLDSAVWRQGPGGQTL